MVSPRCLFTVKYLSGSQHSSLLTHPTTPAKILTSACQQLKSKCYSSSSTLKHARTSWPNSSRSMHSSNKEKPRKRHSKLTPRFGTLHLKPLKRTSFSSLVHINIQILRLNSVQLKSINVVVNLPQSSHHLHLLRTT